MNVEALLLLALGLASVALVGSAVAAAAIAMWEKEASTGPDPEMRSFARATLPKPKQHVSVHEDLAGTKTAAGG